LKLKKGIISNQVRTGRNGQFLGESVETNSVH